MGGSPSKPRRPRAQPSDGSPSSSSGTGEAPNPSLPRMCAAVEAIIAAVGEDLTREGLFDTPKVREARVEAELGALDPLSARPPAPRSPPAPTHPPPARASHNAPASMGLGVGRVAGCGRRWVRRMG